MWPVSSYLVDVSAAPSNPHAADVEAVFDAVWRFDFAAPGFCVLDVGPTVDSHGLRSAMLQLQKRFNDVAAGRGKPRFVIRSLGRFDQQETTKFHLDGAPDQSLLVLGYEPSTVRSRVALADYTRCAFDLGIEPKRFLDEFNPMYHRGEELLARYVTELPEPRAGHSRILVINNSARPLTEARTNALGVLHQAVILEPDERARRVVNSMMLAAGGIEDVDERHLHAFVATDEISKKFYG